MRLTAPGSSGDGAGQARWLAFSSGAAAQPGLESLEYFIYSVQICESMEVSGSGFNNPQGCLELYHANDPALAYDVAGDWRPLADAARATDRGFIDLMSPPARAALGGTTPLQADHVRSYHYGIITWSLPIKVKATVPLFDGTFLYTHDGETTYRTIGADNYRDYYTAAATSLAAGPAEKAVVILGNGGNWFRFQNPLVISQADIDERRQWVLDLVFNPEGIVKAYAGDGLWGGHLREESDSGASLRALYVPMLDLAPVPHRASEGVVRETYLASLAVGAHAFDVRLELYSIETDPNRTVYGVDVKTLVTADTTQVPPDFAKVSSLAVASDGTLDFQSYDGSTLIGGFQRLSSALDTTTASITCGTHADRAAAEGGAAIVVDSCPSSELSATFTLIERSLLDGAAPGVPLPSDAGATVDADAGATSGDASP